MSSQNVGNRNILALTVINSSHDKAVSGHISSQPTMIKDILVVSVRDYQAREKGKLNTHVKSIHMKLECPCTDCSVCSSVPTVCTICAPKGTF